MPTKNQEVVPVEKIKEIQKKGNAMLQKVESVDITDEKSVETISKGIKQFKKFLTDERDKFIKPAKAIIEEAKSKYDPILNMCKEAEVRIKERFSEYKLAEIKKEEEKKEKLAKRVEKGTMKAETAVKKIEELPETKKTSGGMTVSTYKDIEITDEKAVPEEYWTRNFNTVKLRNDIIKEGKEVPGVKVVEKTKTSFAR